jgi:predicted dithiol-disulfide oxidoreductase (DUF899 family)
VRRSQCCKSTSGGWGGCFPGSFGSDFNFDFNVSFTEEQQRDGVIEYNYRLGGDAVDSTPVAEPVVHFATTCGTDVPTYSHDRPGMSAFVLEVISIVYMIDLVPWPKASNNLR